MGKFTNDVLVSTEWLASHLDERDLRIVDVDEDTEAYDRGHIPGAIGLHWVKDLQDPIRRDFIGAEAFGKLMDRIGVTNQTPVVFYGGNNNWFAAYAYWYLKFYGHTDVKLADGGRKKWELEGRELTTDLPKIKATRGYKVAAPNLDIRAFRDFVADEVLGNASFGLVDVRSPEEFRGEVLAPPHLPQEQAQRPGHIPGAASIPWSKAVNPETGEFLSADELKKLYEGAQITPKQGDRGLLPDRRTQRAHMVRPARAPRVSARAQLRRLVDRVGLAGECPDRKVVRSAVGGVRDRRAPSAPIPR
jgi:thiosulfate/3-mercaptopyruvate sulfurtransferase